MTPTDPLPTRTDPAPDPLAPLIGALLERARNQAAEALAGADAEAAATVAHARAEADALLGDARAKGRSDAAEVLAREQARAEREARAMILAAQQEATEQLRAAARSEVSGLRHDPVYPRLLAALRVRVQRELGPDAAVVELPAGGIRASHGDRHLDFALEGLADDLADGLGGSPADLWAP